MPDEYIPLYMLTLDQVEYMLQLIDDKRNDGLRPTTWENIIRFLDGRTQDFGKSFNSIRDVIEWLETEA